VQDYIKRFGHRTLREPCLQSELSPDGSVLACLNAERTLQLIDVANSSVIHQQKDFFNPSFFEALTLLFFLVRDEGDQDLEATGGSVHLVNMAFSPDGRYFLAAHGVSHLEYSAFAGVVRASPPDVLLFDLAKRSKMSVPSSIQNELGVSFTFLEPDKIVGTNPSAPQKSRVLHFPSGDTVEEVQLWRGLTLRGAAHGNALLVGPLKDFPLGIMDLTTKDNRVVIKQHAADLYDGVFVTERLNGELALHTKDAGQLLGTLNLPESNLGRLPVSVASEDLKYLAVSSRTRAAVWDIPRDFRVLYTRRFNAAGFDHSAVYADFPKFDETPRKTGELQLDSGALQGHDLKDEFVVQRGLYLVVTKPRNKDGTSRTNADVEVRDVRSGNVLWTRYFADELPVITLNPDDATVMFRWRIYQPAARNELQKFPQLKERAQKEDYLCEVLDAKNGVVLSALIIKTNNGSLHFLRGSATRNWVVMEATGDQIMTYALQSGEEKGHFFGSHPLLSLSGLLAVNSEKRELTVYDLSTSEVRLQYTFAQPVASKAFSADGKRLLVFTTDQTVYLLDTAAPSAPEPALASNPGN
jgi:WD40 repeat protein